MRGFLYFIPGLSAASADDIDTLGLSDVLGAFAFRGCSVGPVPDGAGGVVVASNDVAIGYHPEKQVWRDCGAFWIGWERDAMPDERDLRRDKTLPGIECELRPGCNWIIPPAAWLPRFATWDNSGCWVEELEPEYVAVAALGDRVREHLRILQGKEEGEPMTFAELLDIAVAYLALNYRIGKHEASALRLLTRESLEWIQAVCSFDPQEAAKCT